MPTYQYACTACGEKHEAVQAFTDAPLTDCPACGGRLRKVFSAVGVVFKGSGFYKTDSRSSKGEPAKADAGGSGKGDGGSGKGDGGSGKGDGSSGKGDGATGKSDGGAGKSDGGTKGKSDSSSGSGSSGSGSGTTAAKTA